MPNEFLKSEAPAASRRERRKQEFRNRILEAAIQLFETQGCEATTLEHICDNADVSRPTFYKYYASKQELIQALGEMLWLDVAEDLTATYLQQSQTTQEYIHGFLAMIRSQFKKYSALERELIRQNMVGGDSKDSHSISIMHGLTDLFVSVYEQGRKRGEIGNAYPVRFQAEMTMGALNTVMMSWAVDESYPLDARLRQLADYLPRMLQMEKR